MELRKVQRTSSGSFFVCLPKDWAESVGLDRGSVVAVSELVDGRLAVDAKYDFEREPRMAVIKPSLYLNREITGKYLLGYDVIRVMAEDRITADDRESVKAASSGLIGLEIVEEDYSKIVLQCLLEPSTFPPEKILRREYSIAAGMHRDAVRAFAGGDSHLARNVVARDVEVDRLYFLLVRLLRTIVQSPGLGERLGVRTIECLDYRLMASLVESVGDLSVEVAEKAVELGEGADKGLSEPLFKLHEFVFRSHERALEAVFSRDVGVAEGVRRERERVEALLESVEVAVGGAGAVGACVLAVAGLVGRIFDCAVDVADLVMRKEESEA
ncbi:MAG: phosphate uptake regulator PhoU [Candidatus Bathyarchaeota archaeon]|nr:MAG: phosphate uptake regulator PhoU [Candidatus Bathyarchaeota archaeon]